MLPIITVEGRVVADPELRFGPSGTAVGKFRIVTQDRRPNDAGVWEDVGNPLWLQVTCFKQLAENVVDSLVKGDSVIVVGKLQTDEWETEGGEKRSATVLLANTVGPSLMFRSTPHSEGRAERTTSRDESDRWSGGGQQAAPARPQAQAQSEDPPF